jgi:hypothetical protein
MDVVTRTRAAAGALAALALLVACGPAAEGPDPAREDPVAPDEDVGGY